MKTTAEKIARYLELRKIGHRPSSALHWTRHPSAAEDGGAGRVRLLNVTGGGAASVATREVPACIRHKFDRRDFGHMAAAAACILAPGTGDAARRGVADFDPAHPGAASWAPTPGELAQAVAGGERAVVWALLVTGEDNGFGMEMDGIGEEYETEARARASTAVGDVVRVDSTAYYGRFWYRYSADSPTDYAASGASRQVAAEALAEARAAELTRCRAWKRNDRELWQLWVFVTVGPDVLGSTAAPYAQSWGGIPGESKFEQQRAAALEFLAQGILETMPEILPGILEDAGRRACATLAALDLPVQALALAHGIEASA